MTNEKIDDERVMKKKSFVFLFNEVSRMVSALEATCAVKVSEINDAGIKERNKEISRISKDEKDIVTRFTEQQKLMGVGSNDERAMSTLQKRYYDLIADKDVYLINLQKEVIFDCHLIRGNYLYLERTSIME